MEIEQFRVMLKAKDFERTCRFYGETLALARLSEWQEGEYRGAVYQAGPGAIEVVGRSTGVPGRLRDEAFEYQGPQHKLVLTLVVPSAQKAYDELIFREKNIPGGLRDDPDGALVFETHDPDGVKVVYREE